MVQPSLEPAPAREKVKGLGNLLLQNEVEQELGLQYLLMRCAQCGGFGLLVLNLETTNSFLKSIFADLTTSERLCWKKIPAFIDANKDKKAGEDIDSPFEETWWLLLFPRVCPQRLRRWAPLDLDEDGWVNWGSVGANDGEVKYGCLSSNQTVD